MRHFKEIFSHQFDDRKIRVTFKLYGTVSILQQFKGQQLRTTFDKFSI